jgi:hypothetical protein
LELFRLPGGQDGALEIVPAEPGPIHGGGPQIHAGEAGAGAVGAAKFGAPEGLPAEVGIP